MSFVLSVRPCLTRVFENHDIVIDASGLTQGGVALLYNSITNIFVFSNSCMRIRVSSFDVTAGGSRPRTLYVPVPPRCFGAN